MTERQDSRREAVQARPSARACHNGAVSTAPQSPQQPEPQVESTRDEVRVRRAPKYPVFIFGGVVVGVIATFVAVLAAPGDDQTPFPQVFGYFVLYGIAIGALFGAVVAVVFDAVSNRRARSVETERQAVDAPRDDADDAGTDSADSAHDPRPIEGELE